MMLLGETMLSHIFWFLIVILLVVFVHELGHFLMARLCGIKVDVFSIGFGKTLLKYKDKYGTEWRLSLLPLGGYVKMFGDENAASTPDLNKIDGMTENERSLSFHHKSLLQKALVIFMGPAFNYILAIFIFALVFGVYGKPTTLPIISKVEQNSPAQIAGLQENDVVVSVDGAPVADFADIQGALSLNVGEPVLLTVNRLGELHNFSIVPALLERVTKAGEKIIVPVLGIASSHVELKTLGLSDAFYESIKEVYSKSYMMLKALKQLLFGTRNMDQLGGPVKIAQYSKIMAEQGLPSLLWLIGLISLNLGLVNLLPIPLLDGGHLFYYAIQAITGKPITPKIQNLGFKIGGVILFALMAVAIFNDIKSLLQ